MGRVKVTVRVEQGGGANVCGLSNTSNEYPYVEYYSTLDDKALRLTEVIYVLLS